MFDQSKIIFSTKTTNELLKRLDIVYKRGDLGMVKRIQALLAISNEMSFQQISKILRCSVQAIYLWIKEFILKGMNSLKRKKASGRPSKLTNKQKVELGSLIDAGPTKSGYPGACWRSPMIQDLIHCKFNKFYAVKYIAELLKNMNFSYQKAKFVSDHLDKEKRKKWLDCTWPQILKLAKERKASIMFGDEVSFPMWGSLSYTWSRKGNQPTVKTSGKRKGHKIFGLISYTNGNFFSAGTDERFNSESYINFLQGVFSKTTQHIILIQDGAPYHTSKQTKEFFHTEEDQVTVFQLPSYSPDFNPIEKLWKKIKQTHIHLHYFPTFNDLKNKVQEAMLEYKNLQNEVLALFGFYRKFKIA